MAVGTTHDRSMRECYPPKVPRDAVSWLWVAWRKGGGCFNLVKSPAYILWSTVCSCLGTFTVI